MKRTIAALAALAVVAAAAVAYQIAARQRDYRALVMRGDAALRDDQTFAAIEAYSGAIALRPDSMLAHLRRGETYRRRAARGDLEAAARDFRTAAELDRSATRPLEELGDVSYQLERFDRALDAYERAVRLDDRSARLSYKLALVRYRGGDVDAALATLDQTLKLDPRLSDAVYLRGVCFHAKGRALDAVKAFEKAVTLAPASIAVREELADLYADLDRRADQLEQLQVLAGLDRGLVPRQIAIGLAHARAHRWDAAVLTLRAALERHEDDPRLYRVLGQVWLESALARDDRVALKKAREALDRVAALPGAPSETLLLAGRAALEDGDVETAEYRLQQAVQRFPIARGALLAYATVAERQRHFDDARRALIQHEALDRDEADFAAHAARIAALSLRVGDRDTALLWARRGLEKDPQNAALLALANR